MGGGLMQLVAYGAQDIYLTGNPQITFFKVVYRRHTNFSMEAIQQTFNGNQSAGGRQTATISRNGDLVTRLYLQFDAAPTDHDLNVGCHNIGSVEIEIGGQRIDKQFGHWMETWFELTEPNPSGLIGDAAVDGSGTKFQRMSGAGGFISDAGHNCCVPLPFWFCRNPGLALPLIALQYHEVKVIVEWQGSAAGITTTNEALWADYIYLDTDERRRFAQVSHEYLIEQVQHQTSGGTTSDDLNFNHPVKELIWTGAITPGDGTRGTFSGDSWQLKLNGHDRFAARPTKYFALQQVWQHHTGTPTVGAAKSAEDNMIAENEIAVYSFSLKPEEHQPSGTCNFSRIDNAQLKATAGSGTANMNIYAVNYNVLRIMSGMGGLAYSN